MNAVALFLLFTQRGDRMGKKITDTLAIQLAVFCEGDMALETMSEDVIAEFERVEDTERLIKDPASQRLYKVLHATRALDTGLELFLTKKGDLPLEMKNHHLRAYITRLSNSKSGTYSKLNPHLAQAANENIVFHRNRYVHKAGKYPNNQLIKQLIPDIFSFYHLVLGL